MPQSLNRYTIAPGVSDSFAGLLATTIANKTLGLLVDKTGKVASRAMVDGLSTLVGLG